MQTLPPLEVETHFQLLGQSLGLTQPLVHRNDGEAPKHSCDWQSLDTLQPLPRSDCAQVPPLPPPVPPEPPPVPPAQVLGPVLLPWVKPPPAVPSQQVPNAAHDDGHACAASSQRLLVQCRVLTGGPEKQLQYQYGQSSGAEQLG
jgi:hypothetical protein